MKIDGEIIVVDDDPSVRRILRKALQKQSYEVIETADGHGPRGLRLYFEAARPSIFADLGYG